MRAIYIALIAVMMALMAWPVSAEYHIRETNRHYEPGDWETWSATRYVRNVSIGQQYVYFSTTGGITRYDYFNDKWQDPYTISNGLADQNIYVTAFDPATGYLWCIRETGVSYMEPATQRWYNSFYDEMGFDNDERAIGIGFGNQNVYLYTGNEHVYTSSSLSLAFFRDNDMTNVDQYLDHYNIQWFMLHDKNRGKLDYMFMPDGYFFDERGLFIKDKQFRQYNITDWVHDPWNKVWMSTWGLGAARGDVFTQHLDLLQYGLWNKGVDVIIPEKGKFWLAGIQDDPDNAGVTQWDPASKTARYFESYLLTGFDNPDITSGAVDGDIVWFGTRDGLVKYDRKRGSWRTLTVVDNLVDNYIHDVATDGKRIYAATDKGVSFLEKDENGGYPERMTHLNYPALRNIPVYDIELQNNLVWLATEYGIYVHDTVSDSGGFYTGDIGPEDRPTYAVSVYGNQVWFGTEDGVEAFDSEKNAWLDPPARMYRSGAGINRILATEKAVWVATGEGVLKFDRDRNYWVQYTMEDGLPSDMVLSLYPDGDYIWFGTDNGLTRFYWNSPYRID